jgi:hypothetical protein
VVLALIGGPLVIAVPVVVVLAWLLPAWRPWLAFAAMCAAGAVALPDLGKPPQLGVGAFSAAAQAAALIALTAALVPVARRRRGARVPAESEAADERGDQPHEQQHYEQQPGQGYEQPQRYEQRPGRPPEQRQYELPRRYEQQPRQYEQQPRQYEQQPGQRRDEGYYE